MNIPSQHCQTSLNFERFITTIHQFLGTPVVSGWKSCFCTVLLASAVVLFINIIVFYLKNCIVNFKLLHFSRVFRLVLLLFSRIVLLPPKWWDLFGLETIYYDLLFLRVGSDFRFITAEKSFYLAVCEGI